MELIKDLKMNNKLSGFLEYVVKYASVKNLDISELSKIQHTSSDKPVKGNFTKKRQSGDLEGPQESSDKAPKPGPGGISGERTAVANKQKIPQFLIQVNRVYAIYAYPLKGEVEEILQYQDDVNEMRKKAPSTKKTAENFRDAYEKLNDDITNFYPNIAEAEKRKVDGQIGKLIDSLIFIKEGVKTIGKDMDDLIKAYELWQEITFENIVSGNVQVQIKNDQYA